MKPRVKLFSVLLSLILVSWCSGGEINLGPSVQRIDLNEATLNFDGDILVVDTFSFQSLTYTRTNSYTNDPPLVGKVWIGAAGPFSCIIVVADDGAIAGHFTNQASNYELFSDATGQLYARTSNWDEVPIVYTEKEPVNRNSLNGPIQGKLFGHKVGDRRHARDLQTKTTVKAVVPILRRATCEQALLPHDCKLSDANKSPIEARLILIKAQVNTAMENSGIPVEVLMSFWVHIDPPYDVDASSNLIDVLETDGNIAMWRSQAQADLVIMITGSLSGDYGVASRILGFASAVSYNSLSYFSAPNVVGNSFGARPSRFDALPAAQHEYGNGFEVPPRLSTVASHGCGSGFPCPIVNSYSSPDISYVMGDGSLPDPLTMGNAANNNARMISEQRQSVADFNRELTNDLCKQESTLANGPFTTTGAIPDYSAGTCDGVEVTGPGVWFTVVGNGLTQTFSTCQSTDFNTKVTVYTGSCDNLGCVAANIDGGCSGGSLVSWPSTLGAKYFILVHGVENESGDFQAQFFARPTAAPTFTPTQAPAAPTPPTPTPPSPPSGTPVPAPPELCFSDSNTVIERDEGVISIDRVKVGDFLLTPRGTYSRVYSLAHYKADLEADFIQVYTGCREPLEVSGNHLVFVNGTPTRASGIQVGDYLGNEVVTTLAFVKRRGVYAPLTESGDLMVSGVRASSYVGLLPDSGVVWNQHVLGHLLFSPVRMLCRWDLRYCSSETHDEAGYSNLYSWLIHILVCIGHQGTTVSLLLSAISTPFLLVLWLVELSLSSHGVTAAAVVATTWWFSRPSSTRRCRLSS